MKTRDFMRMLIRMAVVFTLGALLIHAAPSWWLRTVAPLAGAMADAGCPYLAGMKVRAEDRTFHATGLIQLDMTMAGGEPLPAAPGTWNKNAIQYLNILLVACAVWAVPSVGFRRRLISFPFMMMTAAIASAFVLAVEIQEAALRMVGYEWLETISIGMTAANQDVFRQLESWFEGVAWIKALNDGGGQLFLGTFAGLIGYCFPATADAGAKRSEA